MNFLNAVSCMIWGLYHHNNGNLSLAVPNYAGFVCTIFLVPGCLYATRAAEMSNPLVQLSKLFITLCYRLPLKLVPSPTQRVTIDKGSVTSSASDVLGNASKKTSGSPVSSLSSKSTKVTNSAVDSKKNR